MRRENFLQQKKNGSFRVAAFQLIMIIGLMIVLIISVVLNSSCSGLTIIDNGGATSEESNDKLKGTLVLNFAKENVIKENVAKENVAKENSLKQSLDENFFKKDLIDNPNYDLTTKAYIRTMPDTNLFTLSIKKVSGEPVYKGLYSQKPKELKIEAGSYDFEIFSRVFSAPEFDAPCYYDSGTVVVESGKTTTVSFLCRQSNGALRFGFTTEFKKRFAGYDAQVEDSKGKATYSYTESRFLYVTPGDVFIRLKENNGGTSFLITRKSIAAMEMVTVNLHSSTTAGGPGGEIPPGNSQVFTGILIDTSSVWVSENVVVGERHDGSTKELALTVEEIAGYVGVKGVWVSGYVAGYLTLSSLISIMPFDTDSNIAIASVAGEKNKENCAGVTLTAGAIRTALNLKSNPGNLGKKVFVKGTIVESYFGLKGVNSVTEYFIE